MKQTLIAVLVLVGIIALVLLFARRDEVDTTPTDGATTTDGTTVLPGDVNGDGIVDDLDMTDGNSTTTATGTDDMDVSVDGSLEL